MVSLFEGDLCLSKVKLNLKEKTIAFDSKNRRMVVASNDRVLYLIDLPPQPNRYI
jgi:hypothetical protein